MKFLRFGFYLNILCVLTCLADLASEKTAVQWPKWELSPQVSIFTPSTLVLTNGSYRIPYTDSLEGGFQVYCLGLKTHLVTISDWEVFGLARIGYLSKTGKFAFTNFAGNQVSDSIRLRSLPFTIGARIDHQIPSLPVMKIGFSTGGGVEWFQQSGSLPNLTQSFWVPYVFFSPSLTVFDPGPDAKDWFGGFTFGLTYQTAIQSMQTVQGWSFDLSLNFLL